MQYWRQSGWQDSWDNASKPLAQIKLQQSIFASSYLDPRTVGYIEAHGTGTLAGDVAEIEAIKTVFCVDRGSPLYIGSIKSNIGHLESVSGLAGLIKAILVAEKGLIPSNADFRVARPELQLSSHDIKVSVILLPLAVTWLTKDRYLKSSKPSHKVQFVGSPLIVSATEEPMRMRSSSKHHDPKLWAKQAKQDWNLTDIKICQRRSLCQDCTSCLQDLEHPSLRLSGT